MTTAGARRRKSPLAGVRRTAAAAAALALTSLAAAQPTDKPAPAPRGKVWHITLRGDLDCRALADEAERALQAANDAGAGLILLELDGDRARDDLVRDLGRALLASDAPVCVWLNDPRGRRVGRGQLLLGLLADRCAIAPRTAIIHESDGDLADLAPEGTDREQVRRELSGAIYTQLRERTGDPDPAAALVSLDSPLWIVRDGPTARLTPAAPQEPATARLVFEAPATPLRLTADDLVALGWAAGPHPSAAAVLSASGRAGASRTERTLRSGLADARDRLERALAHADERAAAIDAVLDLRPRDSRVLTDRDHHDAGSRAREMIDAARALLRDAEDLCAAYPELTALPAPGATTVAASARANATRWRSAFQTRRDRLDTLERRALEHLARGRR